MAKKFKSLTCKIIDKLEAEGRVKHVKIEYDPEYDKKVREIMDDHKRKQAASWKHTKGIILD